MEQKYIDYLSKIRNKALENQAAEEEQAIPKISSLIKENTGEVLALLVKDLRINAGDPFDDNPQVSFYLSHNPNIVKTLLYRRVLIHEKSKVWDRLQNKDDIYVFETSPDSENRVQHYLVNLPTLLTLANENGLSLNPKNSEENTIKVILSAVLQTYEEYNKKQENPTLK